MTTSGGRPSGLPASTPRAIHSYYAYGRRLVSDFPLPELRPAPPGEPTWTVVTGLPGARGAAPAGEVIGVQQLYQDVSATLRRVAGGWRIVVDDTGEFGVSLDGREITVHPYPDGYPDFVRAHLLGRVLATSMHFAGRLVLHGSAVRMGAGAIAFLAPKHTGKSTLALTLTMAGARLLSDDALPVAIEGGAVVWPGVHSLRLREDTAHRVVGRLPSEQRADGKYVLNELPDNLLEHQPCPLVAIYLLAAAADIAEGRAFLRRLVPPPAAAAALVGQSKIPEMLGPSEAPQLLRLAARLASCVPVYQLPVLRDMNRLPEVASQLADWHGGPAPSG